MVTDYTLNFLLLTSQMRVCERSELRASNSKPYTRKPVRGALILRACIC